MKGTGEGTKERKKEMGNCQIVGNLEFLYIPDGLFLNCYLLKILQQEWKKKGNHVCP